MESSAEGGTRGVTPGCEIVPVNNEETKLARVESAINKGTAAFARQRTALFGLGMALINVNLNLNIMKNSTTTLNIGRRFAESTPIINGTAKAVDDLSKKQDDTEKRAGKLKKAWDSVATAVKTAVNAMKAPAKAMFGEALDMDFSERTLQARMGDDNAGSALFTQLEQRAKTSAFGLNDLTNSATTFLSVTSNPQQVEGLSHIAEKMAVFDQSGKGLEGASEAVRAAFAGDTSQLAMQLKMPKEQLDSFGLEQMGRNGDTEGFIEQMNQLLEMRNMGEAAYQKMLEAPKTQLGKLSDNIKEGFGSAARSAMDVLGPLFLRMNAWFSSDEAKAFFARLGEAIAIAAATVVTFAEKAAQMAAFVQTNWPMIEPVVAGLIAVLLAWKTATLILAAANFLLNSTLLANPVFWIVLIIIAVVMAVMKWINAVGGLQVAWLIVCDFMIEKFDMLKLCFFKAVFFIMDLWDKLKFTFAVAGAMIADYMGDMKVRVLTTLENMVNGAIEIVNWFIGALNKIDGVNIELIDKVTFGATAALENEAEKAARRADIANQRAEMERLAAEREAKLTQMEADSQKASEQRQNEIDKVKSQYAQDNGSDDGLPSFGGDTPVDVGNVGRVGSVGSVENDVSIADEDIKFLRDVAEMRYVQNFVTLTPTVAVQAQISERVDLDSVVNCIETRLEEEFSMAAEGVYA